MIKRAILGFMRAFGYTAMKISTREREQSELRFGDEQLASLQSLVRKSQAQNEAQIAEVATLRSRLQEVEAEIDAETRRADDLDANCAAKTQQIEILERRVAIVEELNARLDAIGAVAGDAVNEDVPDSGDVTMAPPETLEEADLRVVAAMADHERTLVELGRLYQQLSQLEQSHSD